MQGTKEGKENYKLKDQELFSRVEFTNHKKLDAFAPQAATQSAGTRWDLREESSTGPLEKTRFESRGDVKVRKSEWDWSDGVGVGDEKESSVLRP